MNENLNTLDTGCWILDTGYWMLDTGYWMLDTGAAVISGEILSFGHFLWIIRFSVKYLSLQIQYQVSSIQQDSR
jgi:hypothetical protein